MNPVKVGVKLEMQDIYRMLKHVNITQHKKRSTLFMILAGLCSFGAVFILLNPQIPIRNFYLVAMFPLLYFAVIPFYLIFKAKNIITKEEALKDVLRYNFSEKGVEAKHSKATELIPWNRFVKVTISDQDYIFYLTRVHAFSIPRKKTGDKDPLIKEQIEANMPKDKLDYL